MCIADNYDHFCSHQAEQDAWLAKRPICEECKEPIQDEYLFDFDGEYVCEECLPDYMNEHYRKSVDSVMGR